MMTQNAPVSADEIGTATPPFASVGSAAAATSSTGIMLERVDDEAGSQAWVLRDPGSSSVRSQLVVLARPGGTVQTGERFMAVEQHDDPLAIRDAALQIARTRRPLGEDELKIDAVRIDGDPIAIAELLCSMRM